MIVTQNNTFGFVTNKLFYLLAIVLLFMVSFYITISLPMNIQVLQFFHLLYFSFSAFVVILLFSKKFTLILSNPLTAPAYNG
ncbi:hypothetical protein NU09_2657 [Flavobacterium beibuense]|uniref:Uncharacterized protein n=1 Tax=Flavobacterium beibuense TaxID=657326 RepID=A0A444W7J0_9FLAO|nr:hypothetical protein NU09_2657 [Flavobacterium beibuense]